MPGRPFSAKASYRGGAASPRQPELTTLCITCHLSWQDWSLLLCCWRVWGISLLAAAAPQPSASRQRNRRDSQGPGRIRAGGDRTRHSQLPRRSHRLRPDLGSQLESAPGRVRSPDPVPPWLLCARLWLPAPPRNRLRTRWPACWTCSASIRSAS